MDYAKDGDLSEYDEIDIAIAAEWEGEPGKLMDALLKCGPGDSFGFLEKDEDGVRIHDWGDYSGKLLAQKEKKKERAQKEDKQEPDSDLERWWNLFWDNYPQNRRINKKRSRSLFESIMKCSEEERRSRIKKISLRLAKYCEECETKEARYIMHPSTWLNAYDWSEPLEDGETVQEETFDLEPRGDYGSLREEDDG